MNRKSSRLFFSAVVLFTALGALGATTTAKTLMWSLPETWEDGVTYDVRDERVGGGGGGERFVDIYGGELSRRYGLGGVGEPDLPTLTVNVGIPDGGAFVGAEVSSIEWTPVNLHSTTTTQNYTYIPIPIAEPVQYGAELVYPTPEKGAYEGIYPSEFVVAGRPGVSGGVTMVPITVTPYKWDGTTKTLYKAASLKVKITLQVKKTLRLSTSSSGRAGTRAPTNPNTAKQRAMARTINPDDLESAGALRLSTSSANDGSGKEIIIVSPSEFVPLWEGYAAFRKNTEAGKDFTYTIVNTADIYADSKYWTAQCEATKNVARSDNADALAIHHYLEEHYDANKEQYIILGAAPTKYQYDRATMIPARYVVNQNSYDQVCDMYYGCMDRKDGTGKVIPLEEAKKMDEPPEVWDYNHDGWYMGSKNAGGGYTSDEDARVDWDMDVPVTRVPLMREVAETKDGKVYHMNAAQIMDNFTNRIAFAENPATWTSDKSWRHVLGGGYLFNSYARGSKNYLVRGERQFFDGGINHFDQAHQSPSPDAEACPRSRNFEQFSCYRAARHGLINTGGLETCPWSELYTNFGDCFEVDCHGWARGADPGTTGGALFSTGLWRVYNMALPCESGMYDYCPNGSYGITNCVSMGEAPLLCYGTDPNNPKNVGGGLVTFNNSRYGWWGGYNNMSSAMERLINWAFYQHDMNAGQACVWMHNNSGMKTTKSRGGATNIEVIMHGDPLIKISPQYDRSLTAETTEWNTNTVDYTKNLYVDVTDEGDVTFDVTGDDLAAARLKMVGNSGQTITLSGTNGMFRTTDATVVTNANLTWNVAGGAGRNGIEFVGEGCNLTFEGKAKRYVGYKVLNAASVNVTGGNVTFDFDDGQTEETEKPTVFKVGRFAFGGTKADTTAYNVIRTRAQAFFSGSRTIGIVNNCVELQTWNIGGGTTANKDAPLFFLTNSYLKVTYNPYWETEYFVRPTHLTDSRIVGEYEKFGFGRPEGYGYDLYVWGTSYIEGTKPIMLNGELRVHLMNGATLEIANPMSDGHGGMAGSIRVMGAGTLRITGEQTFTGGITVQSGTKLEFTIVQAVKCDVTVEEGGEMKLGVIPLEGVKTITMRSGSKLVLPYATGAGVYQIIDSSTSSIVLETGAQVYDAADLTKPLEGKLSEGYFLLTANLIDWQGTSGTWKNDAGLKDNWRDAKGDPIGFTNTMPVVFGQVESGEEVEKVEVTVEGEVKPGFINFDNAGVKYTFLPLQLSTTTPLITIESLASSYDVKFGVNLALGNVLKVLGGSFTAVNVESPQINVSGGALHVTGAITEPKKKVRTIKFEFAKTQDGTSVAAVQELRIFRGDDFVPLPTNTIIEDIAGQKIKITGHTADDKSHTYEWLANKPKDENESLKALIDGVIGGRNKWWASQSSAPTWFTITFPEPQELVTGYAIEAADANYRNPKTWRVYTSPGTDNLTLAGGKDGYTCDLAKQWMGRDGKASSGNKADFEIQSVDGALVIHNKGTLVADGECRMNLKFEVGATLAVTNTCALSNAVHAATLTLPEEDGSVLVDASKAAVTDQAFPILRGYELTPEQFRKFRCESDTAVINLKDGDLYVVTDGIRKAPYTATVSEWAEALAWDGLNWVDGTAQSFTWDALVNYRTDGDATINLDWVDGRDTTLNLNVGGALGSLTLGGRAADPITLSWGAALVPRTLDFRPYAGPVTLNYGTDSKYALGYADFYAGRDTVIPSASSGTLVIEAGKRAIIPGWGDFAKITGDGTVAIRLAKKGDKIEATWGNEVGGGTTTSTNILELLRGTWKIENANDYPKTKEVIVGADGVLSFSEVVDTSGYRVCPTGLTVENGGEVHFGKRDTFNRKLTLRNGGKVLMTADATDSNRALDIFENATIVAEGVAPSWFGGTEAEIDGETGDPIVKSGIIALRRPKDLTVTVGEGATLRMFSQWGGVAGMTYPWAKNGAGLLEFYRPSEQTGNMTIEEGVVRLVNKGQGTKGTIVNNAELQVLSSNKYVQTVANVIRGMGGVTKLGPGTTVLTGVNLYSGDTTVEEGTLKLGNAEALGASSVWMKGGVLDMGALRMPDYTVNATREAALLAAFKIRAELTTAESLGQVQLVKLGAFAEYLTSGELKQLFTIVVNGVELKPEEFKIVVSGGIAEYQPDQLTGYNYPLETIVATSNDWAAFEWRDQSGVAFTNDWSDYPNATVVVNVESGKSGQMTFAHGVTTPRLTINNKGGYLEIGGGAATLHPAGMVDATGCGEGSVTFLNFDLGACNIDTGDGEVILLPGCSGTLNTDPGSIVTVTNGTGKGTAVLAAGSELRFLGTTPMNNLLWCSVDNRSGAWIGYGFPITIDEAAFGGVGEATRTDGNFHFQGNLQMVTKRFVAGNGTGTVENFKQTGGSIDVTGNGAGTSTSTSTVLLGHWPSTITWKQSGGTFTATNAPTILGWDGKVAWTMTDGTTRLRGLWAKRVSTHDNTSSFTLAGGRLEIGDLGLIFTNRVSRNALLTLAGGTLSAYTNAIVDVQKGIVVAGNSVISAETNALLTVDATITGEGVLTAEGEGVVRYVGDCSAAKLAGKFEIQVTEAQRQGTTSSVLFTLPDGVTVPDVRVVDVNGQPAEGGNGAAANGKYHWVPSGTYVQPITATLNGGEVKSYETKWYDAAGTEIAFTNLTTAMELVVQVTADTTLVSYDTKTFGKMTFTGGHKLTLKSVLTTTTVATAEVLTDVVLEDSSFTFSKVTALSEGATLTIDAATCIGSFGDGPFAGTLVCDGFDPGNTWSVFRESARWQGVLKVTANVEMENKALGVYGNSSSTFDIAGAWSGYLLKAGSTDVNIKLSNTFTLNDGYSSDGGYKFNGALSGAGTIQTSGGQTDVIAFMGDASQFRGTIDVKGGHCVSFGDQADDGLCEGKIAILSTTPIIAADKTWGAQNGIVVQNGGVLSVEFRNGSEWAAGTSVTVNSGGTLNLVRTDDSQREFKVSNTALSLNGTLTLNGVQVPSWGFEQNEGTITLKEKAVCILPVKANVSGSQSLIALTFTDSAEKPNTFTTDELQAVSDLEIDFTMTENAELVVDNTLGARVFRFLGDGASSVIGSTGSVTVYAGKDTTFDTAGDGVLVIESGMKATAPSWPANKVLLLPDGWLKLTGSGAMPLPNYTVANATLELAGDYELSGGENRAVADSTLVSSGKLTTGSHENGMKPGSTLNVTAGTMTLNHRFIMSQGSAGTACLNQTGGEITSGATSGNLYVGGYDNSRMVVSITGGRFSAAYAPYVENGVTKCYGTTAVSGEGVFAPRIITLCNVGKESCTLREVEDVTVSTYNHNLYLADGGTFAPPAIIPNWFATSVTNGTAKLVAPADTTLAKGPITIAKDCVLDVTDGTLKLANTPQGEGTLNVSESAALDLNGHSVYNVTGSGTVTNSSAAMANVIYNTTFNTNLTFNCNVKLENPYVDVAEACEEIQLITKGTGIIASMDGVRVRVNGKLDRRTWKLTADRKGIELSVPYSAFLTKTTNWNEGKGEGLEGHGKFQNDKAYSIVITNIADEATLTFDTDSKASVFKVVSDFGKVVTIAKNEATTLDFDAYDFSEAHGRATLAYNPGGLSVTAGTDTHLPTGGNGKLTIPSGATAVVGAEFASYANEGTLRRDYDCGEKDYGTILKGTTSSTNSFKSVTFTGGMQAAKVVIQTLDGDRVTLKGTSGNYGARTQSSFDVRGGTLRIESNAADTWYGANGTTTFRQSGGVFEVTASNQSQSGNVGFMFGYANTSASTIPFDISGGHFLVENTSINFYDPSVVNLSGTGLMRAKGVFKAKSDATMTIADEARFELGSLGWRANSAALTMTGGTLTTFESAKMENAITLGGDATIGAAADTTLTLNATVSGGYALIIGTVASNDTGKVVATGSRFACGKLVLAAGTLEIPVTDPLTNDVELTGGKLNLTGLEGAIEYVITTGSLTGATDDNITFNGLSLAAANLKRDGNKLLPTVAVQPFHLDIPSAPTTYTSSWTNAPWLGVNNVAVTPDQWSLVCEANVTVAEGVAAALTVDSPITVEILNIANKGELNVQLAHPDFSILEVTTPTPTPYTYFTVVGQDGAVWPVSKFGFGTNRLDIACGTRMSPFTIDTKEKLLESRDIRIAEGATLRMHELSTGSGNSVWTIAGEGWDQSTLILSVERGLGFNAGSNFTNLTLVVDAAVADKTTYFEQRSEREVLTDSTVDLVITNNSKTIVQGSSSFGNTLNIGNLSGDGTISGGSYNNATLGVNLHSESTFDGVCKIPMIVSGDGHTLTLTAVNTGAITVTNGATVKLALDESATHTAALSGDGTVEVASGTLRTAGDIPCKLVVDAAGRIDIAHALADEFALSTQGITFGEGASVTNNLTANGEPLAGRWTIEGGTIRRAPAIEPFALAPTFDSAWTSAGWRDADGEDVVSHDWSKIVTNATITVDAGTNATLTVNRDLSLGTLEVRGAGVVAVANPDHFGFSASSIVITNVATLALPGCTAGTIQGNGSLVLRVTDRDTTVNVNGAFDTTKFFGPIRLDCGTWNITDNYPTWFSLSAVGENAVLRFNKQDLSGYGYNFPDLVIADGATLRISKRDTFDRKLVLKNGAKMVLDADNLNSGRAFDFFSKSSLDVRGAGVSTIGSGILAIRRSDFTVTVDEGAELQCYSQWATADGKGGNFIKAGAGKIVQYRESTCALPFVVSGGTLKLVDGGRTTTAGITLNSGMKLELSATDAGSYTLANLVSGAGRLEKLGTGTYKLTAANTYTGGTTVSAGTLVVGNASALGTASVTVRDGATLGFTDATTIANAVTLETGAKMDLFSAAEEPAEIVLPTGEATLPAEAKASNFFTVNGGSLPEGNWVLEDGKLVNKDIRVVHFTANVTNDVVWSTAEGLADTNDIWNSTTSSTAILTNHLTKAATVTFDQNITADMFTLVGSGTTTLVLGADKTATIREFVAGGDTRFTFASEGMLTIPAGMKATLTNDAEFVTYVNQGGTLRFERDASFGIDFGTLVSYGAGTYEFRKAQFTGSLQHGGAYVLGVREGDDIVLNGNTGSRSTLSFDITGGRVATADAEDTWFGDNSTTRFAMSGGEFVVGAHSTATTGTKGFLLGYTGGASQKLTLDVSGGIFSVTNTFLNFYNPTVINLTGGTLSAKGIRQSGNAGTINIDAGATLAIGAYGIPANSATLNLKGGTIRAYATATIANAINLTAASTIAAAPDTTITVNGTISGNGDLALGTADDTGTVNFKVEGATGEETRYKIIDGTLTIAKGVKVAINGTVKEGWIAQGGYLTAPVEAISINIIGGNTNRGGKSITSGFAGVAPVIYSSWNQFLNRTDGTSFNVLEETVDELMKDGSLSSGLVKATLSGGCAYTCGKNGTTPNGELLYGYIDDGNYNSSGRGAGIVVENIPYTEYTVYVYFGSDSDGGANGYGPVKVNDVWYPAASTGWGNRAQSRTADPTLQENVNYRAVSNLTGAALAIYGSINGKPSGTRCGIAGIQIVNTGTRIVYEDLWWDNADVCWTNALGEVREETDTTILNARDGDVIDYAVPQSQGVFVLPESGALTIAGHTNLGTRTLSLPADLTVTLDGTGLPTANFVGTGTLRFIGTYDAVPYLADTSSPQYNICFAGTIANGGDLSLGNAKKTIAFGDGCDITANRFVLGNQAGTVQHITLAGGRITLNRTGNATSNGETPLLLSHWKGDDRYFKITGGELYATNGVVRLGWDGGVLLQIGGGEATARMRAKGIRGGSERTDKGTFTLDVQANGILEIGTSGISMLNSNMAVLNLSGGTIRAYANATVDCATGLAVTSGSTLAADEGATLTVASAISGVENITLDGAGTVVLMNERVPVAFAEGSTVKVGYVVDINDCGSFMPPSGVDPERVALYKTDGTTKIATTVVGGKLTYEWEIDGKNCWWDYEFNGNVTSVGTDTATMSEEGTKPYYNTENTALWVGHATHYRGASYPEEFTAVLYGKMVNNQGHLEIGFGSTTAGTKVTVSIACGNPANNEVKLLVSEGFEVKKTVLMSVPNAYAADHLYAFVVRNEKVGGGGERTKVIVYLDGVEWDSFTFDGKVTLGGGFQIGSVHGGAPTGYAKATTANANAFLDFLRVYKTVLNQAAMTKYAEKYPYTSENGSSVRTFAGEEDWAVQAGKPWNVTLFDKTQYATNVALNGSVVRVDATSPATITMNLAETTSYEALEFKETAERSETAAGRASITLVAGEGAVTPTVSGLTKVGTDVTNAYDAVHFGKIDVAAGRALVFDFMDFPFTNHYASTTITFTGAVSGEGAITAVGLPTEGARTAVFAKNASNHYELRITVTPQPFIYTIAEGEATGVWTWDGQEVTEAVVDANPSVPIQKDGAGTLEKDLVNNRSYIANEGLFKATNAKDVHADVTVNEKGVFDFNGSKDGYVTVNLKGGSLVNNGGEMGFGSRQIEGIALSADSFVGGTGLFGMSSSGHAENVLDLGGNTLTKTNANVFFLCNTTVTNGTLHVAEGTLSVSGTAKGEYAKFIEASLALAAHATLKVDADRSLVMGAIQAADATIDNAGTISGFTLSGSATLSGNGAYGTITNAVGAVADIGPRLGSFTFAGEGGVIAQLMDDYAPGDTVTLFSLVEDATTTVNTLKDKDGNVIDASRYTFAGGVVTFKKRGMMFLIR